MKRIILLLIFTASFIMSEGQETDLLTMYENSDMQTRQKPGTDKLLADYLAQASIEEDTVYAYIYMPGACPRCESSLKNYKNGLSGAGKKLLLVTVAKDKTVASFYNKKKGYTADYFIYDTDNKYKEILSFSNVTLGGSVMVKATKGGRVITAFDGGSYSTKLLNSLLARTEPMEYKDFGGNTEDDEEEWVYNVADAKAKPMDGAYKDYKLEVSPDALLCETFRNPYFVDDVFFYTDELLSAVPFYRWDTVSGKMKFERCLSPSDKEKTRFVNIDSVSYRSMLENGEIHFIACNAWKLDDGHIGMSYSLPRLFFQSPNNVAYYNKACLLSRRITDLEPDSCTALEFNVLEDNFFYQHFQFSSTGDKIIVGCKKLTWPLEFEPEDYKDKVELNPFKEGYYATDNPFMAAFDRRTGKLIKRFGHLDDIAEKSFTGHYFVDPVSVVDGNELAYTDSYSGKVYVADTSDVAGEASCYTVFDIDDDLIPVPDTTKFYTYDCVKPYRKVFCRNVTDMRITPDRLYCVVAYGDSYDPSDKRTDYTLVIINRKTGAREEYLYPKKVDGYSIFSRGLHVSGNNVYPFEVLKNEKEALLREMKVGALID